jgi:hypothetical protein
VIQPLDPVAFMLRAENRLHGPYEQNIEDLKLAISIDPTLAHANWLLADIHLATGQAKLAEAAAAKACELEPENDAYRLRWARSLEMLARYDDAVHETRAVLDGEETSPVIQAQALCQLGRLATLGDADIRAKTINFYTKSIDIADKLATSQDVKERRAAKALLVECHLAIAREIATGQYNNKLESISQWIGRASGLAEDAIANDGGSLELRLIVADASLAALADMKPTKDPAPWIEEAEQAAEVLLRESDDPLWQRQIKWRLGVAYFHAVRIEHTRRKTASALRYGQKAIENLAEGAKSRQAVPDSEHLVGRLYFHIGAIHAVHEKDHAKAVTWYDKAAPLLLAPVPVTELAVPRRHGEALVSMGVTFWQQGDRTKALELSVAGTGLIEQAVDAGVLGKDALIVPYGNLATMHKDLGNRNEAARYTRLAHAARSQTAETESAEDTVADRKVASNSQQRTGKANGQGRMRPRGVVANRRNGPMAEEQPSATGQSNGNPSGGRANDTNTNRRPRVSRAIPNQGYNSSPRWR